MAGRRPPPLHPPLALGPAPVPPAAWRRSTVARHLAAFSLLTGAACLSLDSVQAQAVPAPLVTYDIPAGPLEEALIRFGRASGHLVATDQALTAGTHSAGLRGRYSVEAGLSALLAGSGLEAVRMTDGGWRVQRVPRAAPASTPRLRAIDVSAAPAPGDAVYATPASVSVVTREQIERLPPRNAADLLGESAGVFTDSSRSDPGLSVNIRGMQDFGRVNVMIDGARQNYQASGHGANGQVYLDPALIGGVDITKGPVSTVGGAGMIAGMVNFRTLEAGDILEPGQQRGGRVSLATGSNAYRFTGHGAVGLRMDNGAELLAAVSRKLMGTFELGKQDDAYVGSVMNFTSPDTVPRATRQDQWSGLVKLGWAPSAEHAFKFSYLGLDTRFSEAPPVEVHSAGNRRQDYKVETGTLRADYAWRPDSTWLAADAGIYYTRTRRDQSREFDQGTDYTRGNFRIRYQTETVGGSLSNRSTFELGGLSARWVNGAEFWHDWTSPTFNAPVQGSTQDLWYVGPTPEGKRTVASGFSEMTLDHDHWLQLIGGLRYDYYRLSGKGQMYAGSIANPPGVRPSSTQIYNTFDVDRHAAAFAPKVTLAVKPTSTVQLFTSYGEGLRPPAITESLMYGMHSGNMFPFYPNPNLKEERSRNWEIGANIAVDHLLAPNDRFRAKLAWFSTRVENYIMSVPIMSPIATASCLGLLCPTAYANLAEPVVFRGIELQLSYDTGRVFGTLAASSIRSDMKDMRYDPFPMGSWVGYPDTSMGSAAGTYTGISTGGPPRLKIAMTAGVRLFDGSLEVGGRMRHEQPSRIGFMSQYKHARTVDAWATWHASKAATLRLAVENVFDKKYVEVSSGTGGYTWAPGRTVIATLTYGF